MNSIKSNFKPVILGRHRPKRVFILVILFVITLLLLDIFENWIITSDTGPLRDDKLHIDAEKPLSRDAEVPRIIDATETHKDEITFPRNYDYKAVLTKLNRAKVAQDDPRLIQIIRDHYILPPSTEDYNLQKPSTRDFSSRSESTFIDKSFFNNTNEGFFIECGAFDGELKSTSLYFEREKKWAGLLVEADPMSFARLRYKNRKAYIMNACLSTTPYPTVFEYNVRGELGRVLDGETKQSYIDTLQKDNIINVQCFPLYSVLLALNQLHVDFFTLDIEGAELDVLKTIPFGKVDIRIMLVEYDHIKGRLSPLLQLLERSGYQSERVDKFDVLVRKIENV